MKPTRRTQPLRKGLRARSQALTASQAGRTAAGYNPKDTERGLAGALRGTGGAQAPGQMPQKIRRPSMPRTGSAPGNLETMPRVITKPGDRTFGPGRRPGAGLETGKTRRVSDGGMKTKGSLKGALRKVPLRPEDRPRTHQTTRGKRRLSFEEAYERRSNDSSRARVEELYGKTATPAMKAAATGDRSFAAGEKAIRDQRRAAEAGDEAAQRAIETKQAARNISSRAKALEDEKRRRGTRRQRGSGGPNTAPKR